MAESFAFSIAENLLVKLSSIVAEQVSLSVSVKKELENLQATLSAIKAVLLDAEENQDKNRQLTDWLRKLKDCFRDAEDLLDEFEYESLLREVVDEEGMKQKVCHLLSNSNAIALRFKMGRKIKTIREKLDKISADRSNFNLEERDANLYSLHKERETHSFVRTSDVIGRDDDKRKLVELLMQSSEELSVVSVVGIGGLGKTCLAQAVYNDEQVALHFDNRMWVCVSDEFNVETVVKKIIISATHAEKCDVSTIDELQLRLRAELDGKRFLLVLDDVWDRDPHKWFDLKGLLEGGAMGSKILVTTRNESVATIMGTSQIYKLKGLLDEECMSLFIKWAFNNNEDKRYPGLVRIGEEIVTKCRGLPLAARTLGGMLRPTREENDWVRVRESEIWELKQNKKDVLSILKLSYDHLPHDLKRCFASCSLFPKDFEFNSLELIQMWIGQNLIQSSKQHEEMEDIGNRYIHELLQISFFQDLKFDAEEDFPDLNCTFKMHDLVHDLALFVAQPEYCMLNFCAQSISENVRHVSIPETNWLEEEEEEKVSRLLEKLNNVRTILFPWTNVGPMSESFIVPCVLRFKCIRVLVLRESNFKTLPDSIGDLKHLRYLDLSFNLLIQRLPNSISKLHHLQILSLMECKSLEELPRNVGKMMSLRHLLVTTQQMTFPLKEREGQRRWFNSLRILRISGCKTLSALSENMHHPVLTSLRIEFCHVLPALSKNMRLPALRILWISNCKTLSALPENMQLPALTNLRIGFCRALSTMPKNLQLPALINLKIESCNALSTLSENMCLPALTKLRIRYCDALSALPKNMHLPALSKLRIEYCEALSALLENLDLPALTYLKIKCCDTLSALPQNLNLPALANLKIKFCDTLSVLSENMYFPALTNLEIEYCGTLSALPEKMHLPTLAYLKIKCCAALSALPEDMHLPSLTNLKIVHCDALSALPESMHLPALAYFKIKWCNALSALPKNMYLPSLTDLKIEVCAALSAFPENMQLPSLTNLTIEYCDALSSLPEMMHLPALTYLRIGTCPNLTARYESERGEEWEKIAHVKYLFHDETNESKIYDQVRLRKIVSLLNSLLVWSIQFDFVFIVDIYMKKLML